METKWYLWKSVYIWVRNEDKGYKGRLLQFRTPFLKAIGKSSIETGESSGILEGDEGTSVFSGAISGSSLIIGSDDWTCSGWGFLFLLL